MEGLPRAFACRGFLAAVLLAHAFEPAMAQMPLAVELRGGATYSTPFARGTAFVPAEFEAVARDLEVGPGLGPVAELALSGGPGSSVILELRAGASMARVTGQGGGVSWEAGRVTALHVLGGVRFPFPQMPGLDVRAGAGKLLYLSGDVNLLEGRENAGVLLSAGLGYRLPGPIPWIGVAEVQRHGFDPAPLAGAGAGAGAVMRVLLHLAIPVWGRG